MKCNNVFHIAQSTSSPAYQLTMTGGDRGGVAVGAGDVERSSEQWFLLKETTGNAPKPWRYTPRDSDDLPGWPKAAFTIRSPSVLRGLVRRGD